MKLRLLISVLLLSWSTSAFAVLIFDGADSEVVDAYNFWLDTGDIVSWGFEYETETIYSDSDFNYFDVTSLESTSYDPTSTLAWAIDWMEVVFDIGTNAFVGLQGEAETNDGYTALFGFVGGLEMYNESGDALLEFFPGGINPAGTTDVPEPGTLGLLGLGLVMLGLRRRIARS